MFKRYVFAISISLLFLFSVGAANAAQSIIREAESYDSISSPMGVESDETASGGQYITVEPGNGSTGSAPSSGIAKYNITITEEGVFGLFLHLRVETAGADDDSCWVRIQNAELNREVSAGNWINANNIDDGAPGGGTDWFWHRVGHYVNHPGNELVTFTMTPGNYTIEIAYREDGLHIDSLVLTSDPDADADNLPLPISSNPNPENNATGVALDSNLSWRPGVFAETFNVYFGSDMNDVKNATVEAHEGVELFEVDVNNVDLGMLEYGKVYYWRVDDIGTETNTGEIWKFKAELEGIALDPENIKGVLAADVTPLNAAQDPNATFDGTGLTIDDGNDIITHDNDYTTMWAGMGSESGDVWLQYELDQVYKLHQLEIWNYNESEPYSLFAAKDVNVLYSIDNETWNALDELQLLEMGSGTNDYEANTYVDMNGVAARYVKLVFVSSYAGDGVSAGGISEIRFLVIPSRASEPDPEDGATDVAFNSILTWDSGRNADVHKIYIGTDKSSVKNGTSDIVDETEDASYEITLGLGQTYYWRVDEVNDAEDYPVWDGPVWKFSTQDFIVVDDFEEASGYGNDDTNAVYLTWLDGESYGDDNGSWMGRDDEPYLQTISRNGDYSAPMQFENDYYSYSEVRAETADLQQIGSDWSQGNPNTLEIWFRADSNDVNEPVADILYAIINDGDKIYYDGDVADIRKDSWTKFAVPLDGINLNNVTSIAIGVEPIDSSAGGDVGTLYFDDIQLAVSVEPVAFGDENLILWYEMEDNLLDSSVSGFDGEPNTGNLGNGGLTYEEGKYGKALVFDGNDDVVTLPIGEAIDTLESCTISTWINWAGGAVWQRVFDFGSNTDEYMYLTAGNNTGVRFAITTGSSGAEDGVDSASSLAVGYWEHIAVVIDKEDGTIKLYRNGDLAGTDDEVDTFPTDLGETTNNYLGQSQWDDPAFEGMIDDFRIYDRALSAGEVKYLYKN